MLNRWAATLSALALGIGIAGCARLSPEMQVIHDAAESMGGVEAVRGAKTLVLEGKGTTYRLGQQMNPTAKLDTYEVVSYRKKVDLQKHQWRMEQVRNSRFLTNNPLVEQTLIEGMDGDVAYDVGANGAARRMGKRVALDRLADFYHHPLVILQAALAEPPIATVSGARQEGAHHVLDITTADGTRLTLYVDSTTKLPVKATSTSYHPNYGDVTIATTFADYAESGGLELPRTLSQTLDRYPNGDFSVASQVDVDTGDLAAPGEAASAEPPEPQPVGVEAFKLADGVWILHAGYNSLLVEFPTYITLIEAPQNDARTIAVVRKAQELVPDKPLRNVVNLHFHIDHSGGVRAAIAEGLTVVTHESNRAYFEEIAARPHTVVADHLAKNPKPLSIETVAGDGPYELKEGGRTIAIHRVKDDPHAEAMLVAYLPKERVLVEGDLYNPGARAMPYVENTLKQVKALGLRVDRVVPIHGKEAVPFADLQTALRQSAANAAKP